MNPSIAVLNSHLTEQYEYVRKASEKICEPLEIEDYVLQPIADVSPPKWHLGHTTWFFETFILLKHLKGYEAFNPHYNFVFNSYYESVGARVIRVDRGNLSRPTVEQVYEYRKHIDQEMKRFLSNTVLDHDLKNLLLLGLNHEQQHQELLLSDIKYILGNNPLFPVYIISPTVLLSQKPLTKIKIPEGVYKIGNNDMEGFSFDNERSSHSIYLQEFSISSELISNAEYLEFMEDGGYADFIHWHADGWEWVKKNQIHAPLYWHKVDGEWHNYTLEGFQPVDPKAPVCHVSYYEAFAYASWKGTRLPTEAEWEVASDYFDWGKRWEWTESAYLPYPGFKKKKGAIGEYNGKFMVSQMVLRGASEATPRDHSRNTYRNFFYPSARWQFTGIRIILNP
jgi:ergothioneine biosynthesis protein EgtB